MKYIAIFGAALAALVVSLAAAAQQSVTINVL
jgi:hypothetical protein